MVSSVPTDRTSAPRLVLGIETSCDETAVAVVGDREILVDLIASQDALHAPYGGIVPELASRRHIEVLPRLLGEAAQRLGPRWQQLEGIAVTHAPGLIGCLLVGLSTAKGLAFARQIPWIGVNHLEAHVQVARLDYPALAYPFLALVISGGHTSLYLAKNLGDYELLGATRDDAAGEAYDKVAKLLQLGFPGGPRLDQLAAQGNPHAVRFPTPQLKTRGSPFEIGRYDFSFSGLKTAVTQCVQQTSPPSVADIAASFQHRVIAEITTRLRAAARHTGCPRVVVAGGVAANRGLRSALATLAQTEGVEICIPPPRHCTDNAVMIAWTGAEYLRAGLRSAFDLNAQAVAELGSPAA